MTFALRFNTSFLFDVKLTCIVFSMLSENFFVTCKVKMQTNVFAKIIEMLSQRCSSSDAGRLSLNSFICLAIS